MKTFIYLLLPLLALVSFSFNDTKDEVYICTGKYSKKYHYTSSCRGLSNCRGSIKKVTLADAKNIGRALCGWED